MPGGNHCFRGGEGGRGGGGVGGEGEEEEEIVDVQWNTLKSVSFAWC